MLGEHTRIIGVEAEAILAEAREELGLDFPVHGVVDALVDGRLDPAVGAAEGHDLGDLPGHVVGDPEALELALLVEVVYRLQSHFIRGGTVRSMQVPHVD